MANFKFESMLLFCRRDTALCGPRYVVRAWIFGSDRSSSSHFVRPSVRPAQVCLEQSIFIFQGQRAIREQSESTQWALRALKLESYCRSLKYCVLYFFCKFELSTTTTSNNSSSSFLHESSFGTPSSGPQQADFKPYGSAWVHAVCLAWLCFWIDLN